MTDLSELQKSINNAHSQFLAAEDDYEKNGIDLVDKIADFYLIKFQDDNPKRSNVAKNIALQTETWSASIKVVRVLS